MSAPTCVTVSYVKPVTGDQLRTSPPPGSQQAEGPASTSSGRRAGALLASATVSRLADQSASIALVLLVIARTRDPRLAESLKLSN